MALREIFALFDVQINDAPLKQLEGGLDKVVGTLHEVGQAVASAFYLNELKNFATEQIELGSRVKDLSERLGIGTTELQKFQFAAGLAGVDSEAAAQALGFLNRNMGQALAGSKESAEAFSKLGIALKQGDKVRELGDVAPEIADAFAKMGSDQERTAVAMQLFGKSGAALIPLLKGGAAASAELFAQFDALGGGLSEDFVEAADKAGDEIDKLKFAFQGVKSRIAAEMLPTLTNLVQKFQGFVVGLQKVVKQTNVTKVALGLMAASGTVAILKLLGSLGKLFGLASKGNLLKDIFLLGPEVALIIGILVAVALAIEDVYTWATGGKSAIGDLLDSLFGVGSSQKVLDEITSTLTTMGGVMDSLGTLGHVLGDIFQEVFGAALPGYLDIVKLGLETTADTVRLLTRVILALVRGAGAAIGLIAEKVPELGLGKISERWADKLKGVGENLRKSGVVEIAHNVRTKAEAFGPPRADGTAPLGFQAPSIPASQVGGNGPTNATVTQTNHIDVTVQGGNSPKETGRAVADGVRSGVRINENDLALSSIGGNP